MPSDSSKHGVSPSQPSNSDSHWERLVRDLQAYSDEQQEAWGDLDDILIARYLAGECTDEETTQVERAMLKHPDLRECVELVRDTLREPDQSEAEDDAAAAATAAPVRSAARHHLRTIFGRLVRAACVFVAFGALAAQQVRISHLDADLTKTVADVNSLQGLPEKLESQLAAFRDTEMAVSFFQDKLDHFQDKLEVYEQYAARSTRDASALAALSRKADMLEANLKNEANRLEQKFNMLKKRAMLKPPSLALRRDASGTCGVGVTPIIERTAQLAPSTRNADPKLRFASYRPTSVVSQLRFSRKISMRSNACRATEVDPPPAPTVSVLTQSLKNHNVLVRWAVADVLQKLYATPLEPTPVVIDALKDRGDFGRAAAQYVLDGVFPVEPHPQLRIAIKELDDEHPLVRWAAIYAVIRRKATTVRPSENAFSPAPIPDDSFRTVPRSADLFPKPVFSETVVESSTGALRGDFSIVEASDDSYVQSENVGAPVTVAMQVVPYEKKPRNERSNGTNPSAPDTASVQAKVVPKLVKILKNKNEDPLVRKMAIYALGEFGKVAKKALPELLQALDDPDPVIRRWAAFAVGGIGSDMGSIAKRTVVGELVEILKDRDKDRDALVRPTAAYAIGEICEADLAQKAPNVPKASRTSPTQLNSDLAKKPPEEHKPAKAAVPVLIESLKDQNASVRKWAAAALLKISGRTGESEQRSTEHRTIKPKPVSPFPVPEAEPMIQPRKPKLTPPVAPPFPSLSTMTAPPKPKLTAPVSVPNEEPATDES